MGKLDGKIAIITGGGQGIGKAIAHKLAADGARVVVNDLDAALSDAVAAELEQSDTQALSVPGDVAVEDFGERIIDQTLDRFGDVDIIINNAGYIWNSAIHNHEDAQFQAMLDVHVMAPFRILRAAGRHFRSEAKRLGGEPASLPVRKIVNISSVSGLYGAATQLSYSTAKAGIIGMTKTLAKEWGRYNATVNAVAFGYIETRLTQSFADAPEKIEVHGRQHNVGLTENQIAMQKTMTPLGRAGQPEDAAGSVLLFCYPESNFVSGQMLVCAGGLEM
jgi:3-oxoacyl-[acyl-carrier protein] reductase